MKTLNLSGKSGCFGLKTLLLPLCMLAVMMLAPQVMAATITVNSTADTMANDGSCTLREAIINANSDDQIAMQAAGMIPSYLPQAYQDRLLRLLQPWII